MTALHLDFKVVGMNRDTTESALTQLFAYDIHNMRIISSEKATTLSWESEKGNKLVEIVDTLGNSIPLRGLVLGYAVLNKYLVLFTKDTNYDYIYRLNWASNTFGENKLICLCLIKKDLGFDVTHPIETLVYYENEELLKVYWTDGLNHPRMINVADSAFNNGDIDRMAYSNFDFNLKFTLFDRFRVTKDYNGSGVFAAGTILFAFTYFNAYYEESSVFNVTPIYYINFADKGAAADKSINCSFTIELDLLDTNYEFIRIYSISRSSANTTPIVRRNDVKVDTSGKVTFIDNGTIGDYVDANSVLYLGSDDITFDTFTHKDNVLFFGNIKSNKSLLKLLDALYLQLTLWKLNSLDLLYFTSNIKDLRDYADLDLQDFTMKFADTDIEHNIHKYKWYNSLNYNSEHNTTFKMSETYRFGILFMSNTGKYSDVFWLGDLLNTIPIKTATLMVPKNIDATTGYITDAESLADADFIDMTIKNYAYMIKACATMPSSVVNAALDAGYIKVRPVITYPTFMDRTIKWQGVLSPTVFNLALRHNGTMYAMSSWFMRPLGSWSIGRAELEIYYMPEDYLGSTIKSNKRKISYKRFFNIGSYTTTLKFAKESNSVVDISVAVGSPSASNYWVNKFDLNTSEAFLSKEGAIINQLYNNYYKNILITDDISDLDKALFVGRTIREYKSVGLESQHLAPLGFPLLYAPRYDRAETYLFSMSSCGTRSVEVNTMCNPINLWNGTTYNFNFEFQNTTTVDYDTWKAEKEAELTDYYTKSYTELYGSTKTEEEIQEMVASKVAEDMADASEQYAVITTEDIAHAVNKQAYIDTEDFYVDLSIVTFHSPDIRFNEDVYNYDLDTLSMRIVGVVPITSTFPNYYLNTKTVATREEWNKSSPAETGVFYTLDNDIFGMCSSFSFLGEEHPKNTEGNDFDKYYVYQSYKFSNDDYKYYNTETLFSLNPWNKKSANWFGENNDSILYNEIVEKSMSNFRYAYTTFYLDTKSRLDTPLSSIKLWDEDDTIIKIDNQFSTKNNVEGVDLNTIMYSGNPDAVASIDSTTKPWGYETDTNRKILGYPSMTIGAKCLGLSRGWVKVKKFPIAYLPNDVFTDKWKTITEDGGNIKHCMPYFNNYVANKVVYYNKPILFPTLLVKTVGSISENPISILYKSDRHLVLSLLGALEYTDLEYFLNNIYNLQKVWNVVGKIDNSTWLTLLPNVFGKDIFKKKNISSYILPALYVARQTPNGNLRFLLNALCPTWKIGASNPLEYIGNKVNVDFYNSVDNQAVKGILLGETTVFPTYSKLAFEATDGTLIPTTDKYTKYLGDRTLVSIPWLAKDDIFAYTAPLNYIVDAPNSSYQNNTYGDSNPYNAVIGNPNNLNSEIGTAICCYASRWYNEFLETFISYDNWEEGNTIPIDSTVHSLNPGDLYDNSFDCQYLYMAEIYNAKVSNRFGGTSLLALETNEWSVGGLATPLIKDTEAIIIWSEGDTYYQRYDCLKTLPSSSSLVLKLVDITSFMVETHINIDGRYDNYRGPSKLNLGVDDTKFNIINYAYTLRNNYFTATYTSDERKWSLSFPNMVGWSSVKIPGSTTDDWTNITLYASINMDGDKGDVTSLNKINDKIICFLLYGTSVINFNEKTNLATDNGTPIELGLSGKVTGKTILSKYGCSNKWSICETSSALYFIDDIHKTFMRIAGLGVEDLTHKFNINTEILRTSNTNVWNPYDWVNVVAHYDKRNKDVYFISKETCLAFSEVGSCFTSFYDYNEIPFIVNLEDSVIDIQSSITSTTLWYLNSGEYNSFFGTIKPFWITVVSNLLPLADKIWNNVEFRSDTWLVDSLEETLIDDLTFTNLEVWDEYQHGSTELSYKRNIRGSLLKFLRVWRAIIPRADDTIRDRIRNTWAYIKLKRIPLANLRTVLHDMVVWFDV